MMAAGVDRDRSRSMGVRAWGVEAGAIGSTTALATRISSNRWVMYPGHGEISLSLLQCRTGEVEM